MPIEINLTWSQFKKSWTDLELEGVKGMVNKYFAENDPFSFDKATDSLATFYTSSSSYAMLNVQDPSFSMDSGETFVSHFALTDNHQVVAVCRDAEDEIEKLYLIN